MPKGKSPKRKTKSKKSPSAQDLIEGLAGHDSDTIMDILREKYGGDKVDLAMKAAGVLGGVGAAGLAAKYALNTGFGKSAKTQGAALLHGGNVNLKSLHDEVKLNLRGTRELVAATAHATARTLAMRLRHMSADDADAYLDKNGVVSLFRTLTNMPVNAFDATYGVLADRFHALLVLMKVGDVWVTPLDANRTSTVQGVAYDFLGYVGVAEDDRYDITGAGKLDAPVRLNVSIGDKGEAVQVEITNRMQYTALMDAYGRIENAEKAAEQLKQFTQAVSMEHAAPESEAEEDLGGGGGGGSVPSLDD
jgi:hypothetical protein